MTRPVLTVQLYREPIEVRQRIGADVWGIVKIGLLGLLGLLVVMIVREVLNV